MVASAVNTGVSGVLFEEHAKKDLVWHYTDGAALKGILENRVLRAGSAAYMNDFKELITGNDVLNKIYGDLRQESSRDHDELKRLVSDFIPQREGNFILSASSDPDSLTLWRYYGRDQVSFAVGLDPDVEFTVREQHKADRHPNPPPGYYDGPVDDNGLLEDDPDNGGPLVEHWNPMIYKEAVQEQILREALENLRNAVSAARIKPDNFSFGIALKKLSLLSELYRIKHRGFEDEKEMRILAQVKPDWKYVLHRPGRFGMIPYVELGVPTKDKNGYPWTYEKGRQKMDRLPIRRINIGPTPFAAEAAFGLKQLLEFLGYHDVGVEVSTIPYR